MIKKDDPWAKPSIAFAHSSVKDYVLSTQFQQAFGSIIDLTKGVSHRFITQTCVRYLLLFAENKHSMIKDTLSDYPMSFYVTKYWFHHLWLCDDQDRESSHFHSHLLLWGTALDIYLNQWPFNLSWYMIEATRSTSKSLNDIGLGKL